MQTNHTRSTSQRAGTVKPVPSNNAAGVARASIFLHPLVLFSGVWLGVLLLYSMHMSQILRYTTLAAVSLVGLLWLPLAAAVGLYTLCRWQLSAAFPMQTEGTEIDLGRLRRHVQIGFKLWVAITIIEVILSKGVPLQWALTGSAKTYTDFGVPSLHGFVNSLQTALALCSFLLFLITRKRGDLKVPILFVLWTVIIINRNMMLVTLIELATLYVRVRRLRPRTFLQILGGALLFVLAFGVIGDVRQGPNALIRDLAQPTSNYPEWLPSGVLWAYIYVTTPLNNLLYTVEAKHPKNDVLFPATISTLFPSVLREKIYGDALGDAESGSLVDAAFNVSTAFIGPYQDFGFIGITLFSVFCGVVTLFFWYRSDLRSIAMFAVVTQCLVLTLFFNHFFYLPVITQLGWLGILFRSHPAGKKVPFLSALARPTRVQTDA